MESNDIERIDMKEVFSVFANRSRPEEADGDYRDENGILVCGICGKPKEQVRTMGLGRDAVTVVMGAECDCMRAKRLVREAEEAKAEADRFIAKLRKASLIDKRLMDASFDSAQITDDNAKVIKMAKRYVEKWDKMVESNQGIMFWGKPGSGKSYISACIANALIDKGVPVVMTSCIRLTDIIQSGDESEGAVLRKLNKAKLMILDDLGAERMTDYSIERVYSIIDARYRSCLPLIVTTNLDKNDLRTDDVRMGRIYSRVLEMCYPIHCTGSFRVAASRDRFYEMKQMLEDD